MEFASSSEFPSIVNEEFNKIPTYVQQQLAENVKTFQYDSGVVCQWSVTSAPDDTIASIATKYGIDIIDVKACGPQVAYVSVNGSYVLCIFTTSTGGRELSICNHIFTNTEHPADPLWSIIPCLGIRIGGYPLETYTRGKHTYVCKYL